MIFLRHMNDGSYECLDGQQRLRSIFEFMNEGFGLTPKITEELEKTYHFSELPDGMKSKIREFIIHAVTIHDVDDEITTDIFLRLQEGMPLNSPEKLNAMTGKMRKAVIELITNKFFQSIGLANTRFGHRYVAAQILTLELDGDINRDNFSTLKFPTLKKYYLIYKKSEIPSKPISKIKSAFSLLSDSLKMKISAIKYRADVISLYTFASYLRENYSISGKEDKIGVFILDFITKVGNYNTLPSDIDSNPYREYALLRASSADSGPNIKKRHEIILSKFLQQVPNIKPKDPERLFNYSEKLAIYNNANGKCEKCSKEIKFNDGETDHKIRHTDGGLTTIDNGRWLCIKCHDDVHR